MKKLWRIENLFLLVPVLLGCYVIIHYFQMRPPEMGPLLSALVSLFGTFVLNLAWLFLPAYLIHFFLRLIGKWNKLIGSLHVVLSFAFCFLLNDNFALSVVPGWHTVVYPPLYPINVFMSGSPWINLAFWVLQITFIVYGLTIIYRWRKVSTS